MKTEKASLQNVPAVKNFRRLEQVLTMLIVSMCVDCRFYEQLELIRPGGGKVSLGGGRRGSSRKSSRAAKEVMAIVKGMGPAKGKSIAYPASSVLD